MYRAAAILWRVRMADIVALSTQLVAGEVTLALFADHHVEPLRAACAKDRDIWTIYPVSWVGLNFDTSLATAEAAERDKGWVRYAVLHSGRVVGMTCYIASDAANHSVELGSTYIEPSVRGTGFNGIMKRLIDCPCLCLRLHAHRDTGRYAQSSLYGGSAKAGRGARRHLAAQPRHVDRLCT